MSNNKMKGLLKGLRYISNIFENEKEGEMQIGFPTDVKHVAHIGWDGPSVNSPSWMNEFKAAPGFQSQPLNSLPVDAKEEAEIQWVSEDSSRKRNQNAPVKDAPEAPKSSRRHASTGSFENPSGEKSERTEKSRTRRSSKPNKDGSEPHKGRHHKASSQEGEPSSKLPDIPKKSRRKKSKDSADGSSRSSRTSRRPQASKSDSLPEDSESVSNGKEQEAEGGQTAAFNSSEGNEEKGFVDIP